MDGPALVVHGHFYQPPRENPWTEELPREPSAAPAHDWNERIAAESYRPNAYARIVDDHGRVVDIVNTYERLSFDVGPTLTSWLEENAPDTWERIVDADRRGGGAIAQAYFHVILPLAEERDVRTNVRWGMAEMRHRFGREAEGIWLPETAVDDAVLAVLAEEGVRFTILAPNQVLAVRELADDRTREPGDAGWRDVGDGSVDTSVAYRWLHPDGSGRGVDVVVYHGALSHSIAFELPGLSSSRLVDRMAGEAESGGLVLLAADGETFGHHHRWGERLLAYALHVEAPERGLDVANVARWLRDNPPAHEVRVRRSAWSCAHGVGRWERDCGCHTGGGPGWTQAWRAPLRAALDAIRDRCHDVFGARGAQVLHDPWAARDGYVDVILGAVPAEDFLERHLRPGADPVEALTLLEAERHALAMYTSCGWFFNDLAGLETVQVLRYAARCADLLAELGEDAAVDRALALLDEARSNVPGEGTGRDVWRRHVEPVRVDEARAVAHLALVELLEGEEPAGRVAAWDVEVLEHGHVDRGATTVCAGVVALTHRRTRRRTVHAYGAVHLGGLEVVGAVRPGGDGVADRHAVEDLRAAADAGSPITTLLRMVGERFGPEEFGLSAALPDAAEEMLRSAAGGLADRFADAYARLVEDHRSTLVALGRAGYPLPPELRLAAELSLARRFEAEVAAQGGSWDPSRYRAAADIAAEARANGLKLELPQARASMSRSLLEATARAVEDRDVESDAVEAALGIVQLARELDLHLDVDRPQELVHAALVDRGTPPSPGLRLLGVALGLAVEAIARA